MVNAQEWLDENYPKEKRKEITSLIINKKNLEGELNLNDFVNLEYLDCYDNKLTKITLPKSNLKELSLSTNNLHQDLSFLKDFVNLGSLDVSVNKFYGSLEHLKDMGKLWRILIVNTTNVDSGLEYLPESLEKFYCKGTKFGTELEIYGNPTYRESDDTSYFGNYLKLLNTWKKIKELEEQVQNLQNQLSQKESQIQTLKTENNYQKTQLSKTEELLESKQMAQIIHNSPK